MIALRIEAGRRRSGSGGETHSGRSTKCAMARTKKRARVATAAPEATVADAAAETALDAAAPEATPGTEADADYVFVTALTVDEVVVARPEEYIEANLLSK